MEPAFPPPLRGPSVRRQHGGRRNRQRRAAAASVDGGGTRTAARMEGVRWPRSRAHARGRRTLLARGNHDACAGTRTGKHAATCRASSCVLACVRATAYPPDLRTADTWQRTTNACAADNLPSVRSARMPQLESSHACSGAVWPQQRPMLDMRCPAGDKDAHIWWL